MNELPTRLLLMVSVVLALGGCSGKDPRVAAGEKVFAQTCKVCHAQGLNGAPILGNVKMWKPRLAQGEVVLVAHAISGYGLMPAKGGNTDLGEEDIANAVKFMISQIEQK